MNRSTQLKAIPIVMVLALLASGAPIVMGFFSPPLAPPQQSATIAFADPAFQTTWQRTDLPVQNSKANRSWMWGPTSIFSGKEPWAESPGGQHLVQYFDKSRMEVNDPNADRSSQWFVTNGLLVVEMMTGKIATGVNASQQSQPAAIAVAGDPATSVNAPTYATTAKVASLEGNNRAPDRTGQAVNQILDRAGNVSNASKGQDQVVNVVYEATLGHNIPNVFWTFMNQTGTVYQNGQYITDKVFDWVFAMGYPLTEPYWVQINVSGKDTWVVMQAYQRRIMTYNPNNDPAFQVEMGNVGSAYYSWRYNQQGTGLPTATPVSAQAPAALKLSPATGPASTTITVSGSGYPAFGAVNIGVSAPNGYNQGVGTVGADAAGNFSTYVTLPAEVAGQSSATIVATSANNAVTLSQQFTIDRNAVVNVTPYEVTSKGIVDLTGTGWTANTKLTLTAYLDSNNAAIGSLNVTTDGNGSFSHTYTLAGKAAVGAKYKVIATGPNNQKATASQLVTIMPLPTAHVNPVSGPAGVNVSFSGSSWPVNRMLSVEMHSDSGQDIPFAAPLIPLVTDAAGNFSTSVAVPAEVAGEAFVTLWAIEDVSGLRVSATYTLVNSTPPTTNPQLSIIPNPVVSNQPINVYGAGYPANTIVSVAIGTVGGALGPAGSANTDGQGNFKATFNLPSSLASAGMVTIAATSTNGTNANVNVTVINGNVPPSPPSSGLPMTIRVKYYGGPGTVTATGTGWPAGQSLTAMVTASDGSVNQTMGTGTVKGDGSFQISFDQNAAWAGRTNLNVKVTAANGSNSVRYLPTTAYSNAGGTNYTFTGANWPRSTKVHLNIVPVNGVAAEIGSATTDANGVFNVTVTVPSSFKGNVKTGDVTTSDTSYSASFTP